MEIADAERFGTAGTETDPGPCASGGRGRRSGAPSSRPDRFFCPFVAGSFASSIRTIPNLASRSPATNFCRALSLSTINDGEPCLQRDAFPSGSGHFHARGVTDVNDRLSEGGLGGEEGRWRGTREPEEP